MTNWDLGAILTMTLADKEHEPDQLGRTEEGDGPRSRSADGVDLNVGLESLGNEMQTELDENLLARVAQNDKKALSQLFRRYARMVRVLAARILCNEAEAEEILQEVFLFLFRKAGLFDPARGSARSWLVQVTYHRAFDRRRYLVSRGFYTNFELGEAVLRAEEPRSTIPSYMDSIEAAIGQDALRRIEASLSEVQRQVLRLHFVDGYSVEEIGTILGQSVGNVRNHYYRALEKMRREVFATKLQTK